MCDLVILEISNMPEATSGCSAALAAAKYYCMKNAAAAEEEEDTPALPLPIPRPKLLTRNASFLCRTC